MRNIFRKLAEVFKTEESFTGFIAFNTEVRIAFVIDDKISDDVVYEYKDPDSNHDFEYQIRDLEYVLDLLKLKPIGLKTDLKIKCNTDVYNRLMEVYKELNTGDK